MSRPIPVAWLIVLLAALVLAGCQAQVEPQPRPAVLDRVNASPNDASLNRRDMPAPETVYRYLVVGHLYGSIQGEDREPARALVEQLPVINELGLRGLISLGDMVKHSDAANFDQLERLLLTPAAFPVYNTPGNHDVEDRALYETRYGPTWYSFTDGPNRLIFLDTERETCGVDAPQRQMLAAAVQAGLDNPATHQILIFMHKTLFFNNARLFELKTEKSGPNEWKCYASETFATLLTGVIEPAAARKPVYLFAGDVGAYANLTPYYEQREDMPITMVMTGLGDFPTDAGILVTVEGEQVNLEIYSLTGRTPPPLSNYSPQYWIKQAEKKGSPQ